MQAQNTFNEGMVLDNHPLMTPNTVLTDALNATLVTMNGNEMVLQNDMGNAKVENAKLPPGYIPIGMKEYGGIIYIACYNPLTNKGQIGCFPSPQRQKTATQISEITPTFKFPDVTLIKKEKSGEEWYKINSLLTKCEIFPKGTIIRSGDKFSVGLPISSMFGTNDTDVTGENFISNYNNVEDGLVKTPMNRMYTFGVATLDNNGQLRDITNQLKRYNKEGQQIQFLNTASDLYKFNCGYWQNEMSTKDKDGLVSSELMNQTSVQSKLNTYNSKLFGRLFLYAKYNAIDNVDVSVVGYKQSEITNDVKNPIYSNPNDSEDKKDDKNIIPIDSQIVLFIYANYKYNCPDGSGFLNEVEVNGKKLVEPYEGYKYYFDKPTQNGYDDNIIRGLLLTLNIGSSTTQKLLEFSIPNYQNEEYYKYKCYTTGYGYPIYDPITNLYSFSQLFTVPIELSSNQHIEWNVTPIMRFYDGGLINGGQLPDKGISGSLDTGNINSGVMKLNTWNYYISGDRVNLRWGYESYPRDNDVISDITFDFYDIASDKIDLKDDGTINADNSIPRWTYITKNRLSYNGTFSENFDINNFISNKASNNIFAPNKLFYVRISYTYNGIPKEDYRWLLLTGLYNPSYWGDDEYSSIQDYNDFLKCYYISNNNNYYIFNYGYTEVDLNTITTLEDYPIVTQEGYSIVGTQQIENKSGTWIEVTDEKEIENIKSSKQRIPYYYFNANITASINTINNIKLNLDSTDNYIFTDITKDSTSVKEHYLVKGTLQQIITLNNDAQHAINTSKWIPNITGVESSFYSNIEYEGDTLGNKLADINTNNINSSFNKNIITTTCNNSEFNTLFGGKLGQCNIKMLDKLTNLPELSEIYQSLLSSNILGHAYAIHTLADTDRHKDYQIDIYPISSEKSYDTEHALQVLNMRSNTSHSTYTLSNYLGKIYSNKNVESVGVNSSLKEQFSKLPQDYNIIVLTSLLGSVINNDDNETNNTSIIKLKTNGPMQEDEVEKPRYNREYPGNIFVLIRSITGEFTLVNYFMPNLDYYNISAMKYGWDQFLNYIREYYYYNPDIETIVYSIIDDYFYSKDYIVELQHSIQAKINENNFKEDYLNVLSKYCNNQVITINTLTTIENIQASCDLCKIPSSKHLINDIQGNNSIVYKNDENIISHDSENRPLKESKVYFHNRKGELILNNQLRIQDNKLYTYNISNQLKTYPPYGWSSRNDSDNHCVNTITLGGMPIITLETNLLDNWHIQ